MFVDIASEYEGVSTHGGCELDCGDQYVAEVLATEPANSGRSPCEGSIEMQI